ncbi:MAG: ACT domain-containing protein [Eubacteriales bacterium]
MKKAVITVVGKDTTGIIYKVTGVLYQCNVNVLDITQTTMQDMFTMIMLTDITCCNVSFDRLVARLQDLGQENGLSIHCQHEDIFNSMHTI